MDLALAGAMPRRPTGRRQHSHPASGALLLAVVAALAVAHLATPAAPAFATPSAASILVATAAEPSVLAGGGPAGFKAPRSASATPVVALEAVAPEWKGSSRYKTYDGFVYRKKRLPGLRLRLDRFGTGHWPFYRIKAAFQKRKQNRSGRFLESLGFWDPMKEVDDPNFLKLKADRCVFWLRNGAQPTDMVASLLDRIGIIRRTGPHSKWGEWEWRIPKNSGPEAPEGWSYDGPHEVTWENKPMINHRKGHPHNARKAAQRPLIERYGFKGYTKIPIEGDAITDPVTRSSLLSAFGNTEIPLFD